MIIAVLVDNKGFMKSEIHPYPNLELRIFQYMSVDLVNKQEIRFRKYRKISEQPEIWEYRQI